MQLPFGEQGKYERGKYRNINSLERSDRARITRGFVWEHLIAFQRGEVEMVSRIPLVD